MDIYYFPKTVFKHINLKKKNWSYLSLKLADVCLASSTVVFTLFTAGSPALMETISIS